MYIVYIYCTWWSHIYYIIYICTHSTRTFFSTHIIKLYVFPWRFMVIHFLFFIFCHQMIIIDNVSNDTKIIFCPRRRQLLYVYIIIILKVYIMYYVCSLYYIIIRTIITASAAVYLTYGIPHADESYIPLKIVLIFCAKNKI